MQIKILINTNKDPKALNFQHQLILKYHVGFFYKYAAIVRKKYRKDSIFAHDIHQSRNPGIHPTSSGTPKLNRTHGSPFPVTVWLQRKMSPEELSSSHLAPRELRSPNQNKGITERSALTRGWFMLSSLYLYFFAGFFSLLSFLRMTDSLAYGSCSVYRRRTCRFAEPNMLT